MVAIFGEIKPFWKLGWLLHTDTLCVINVIKIALSGTDVSIFVFCKFGEKFKMAAIFGEINFLEKCVS